MKAAAVAIGVDKTGGGLTPLGGAASGAEEFARWAEAQGMDVERLLDVGGEVTLDDVVGKIEAIVDSRLYEKLIVFFAGHGFLTGPQSELWLLSRAPDRAHEAINVALSRDHARYCGIPHVILVSDACRSGGSNHRHRSVSGGSAFPTPTSFDRSAEVDTFYATLPGDPAHEFRDDVEATGNYKGILTGCLLSALQGDVADAVTATGEGDLTRWLVSSRQLRDCLARDVPRRAEEISIRLRQRPEVRVESALPSFFGELPDGPSTSRGLAPVASSDVDPESDVRAFVDSACTDAMSFADDVATFSSVGPRGVAAELRTEFGRLLTARGRASFETGCGFTVHDTVRAVSMGNGVGFDHWNEGDVTHIRVHDADALEPTSILIELQGGTGTVLAVKPGFVGTVVVEEGRVVNVNYTPAESSPSYNQEYGSWRQRIERRRAFAAVASRHGVFEISGPEASSAADYLRMDKSADPTLGLYAAYAYHESGRIDAVRDVLRLVVEESPPVPFDIVLLARQRVSSPVAPFCPMLSRGWSLLELRPESAATLRELRRHLVPALWTTLAPEGVAWVQDRLEQGDLS